MNQEEKSDYIKLFILLPMINQAGPFGFIFGAGIYKLVPRRTMAKYKDAIRKLAAVRRKQLAVRLMNRIAARNRLRQLMLEEGL